jgi:hypothetical protein
MGSQSLRPFDAGGAVGESDPNPRIRHSKRFGRSRRIAATAKMDKIQRREAAQEAVLSAIGFMSDAERLKKTNESSHKEVFSIATICGLVDYHLPLPLSCQRNSILVHQH